MSDPFGRAVRDYHRGEQDEPLLQRDGENVVEHPIEASYFGDFDAHPARAEFLEAHLDGPLLDLGAGAGRDALHFQEQFETVGIEVSDHLVETMRDRGVRDARRVDMFELQDAFERDRFQSALSFGTQVGLCGSMQGLRSFLADLAFVTTPDATVVLDSFDPSLETANEMPGFRADPTPGLAFRLIHFEYEGSVGRTLLFRLFSPDRLREATIGTDWEVSGVERGLVGEAYHYHAALQKS
jgi:SAM-dependent methyltransferase